MVWAGIIPDVHTHTHTPASSRHFGLDVMPCSSQSTDDDDVGTEHTGRRNGGPPSLLMWLFILHSIPVETSFFSCRLDFVEHHYQPFDFCRSDTGNFHNDSSMLRVQQLPDIWPEERAENVQFWPDAGNFTTHSHLWIFFATPLLFLSSMFGERKVFFPVFQRS